MLFLLLFSSSLLSQTVETTYYRGGETKLEITYEDGLEIISKAFYKNGQIRLEKNKKLNFIKEYYKNGQLSYYQHNDLQKIEEYYTKDGTLIARFLDDKLEYSLYENVEDDIKRLNSNNNKTKHNHEHGHGHGHGHSH